MEMILANLPLAGLAILMLYVCATDLKRRLIYNHAVLAVAALAIPYWWVRGLSADEALLQAAVVGFAALGFGLLWQAGYWIGKRLIGGGDFKLLVALAFWMPGPVYIEMLFWMALAGAVLSAIVLATNRTPEKRRNARVPYGLAIAAGTFAVLGQLIVKQFPA